MSAPKPISIHIDSKSILSQLKEIGQDRQGPYILSRTINLLGIQVQKDLREMEGQRLNLRRAAWVKQQVRIEKTNWSTKTKLRLVIALSDKASFISRLETGETRLPMHGKWLMVPNDKVFKNKVIKADDALNLHKLNMRTTPFGLQGTERTFMIKTETGEPLVLQRVSKEAKGKARRGRSRSTGLRCLYYGIKSAKIPHKMLWYQTANSTVTNQQQAIFKEVLSKALSNGKKG